MSTNDKYLVLRGKNKDIYFIQKRVSKKISSIIGKEFIKKSLETSNIIIARERRDKLLDELNELEKKYTNIDVPIEISNIELKKDNDVPIKSISASINVNNSTDYVNNDTVENKNVPTNEINSNENEDESDGYFSFIDYSRLPKKEDISNFFDKLFPLAIVFLVIFITLLV
tara:strand:- start:845 stop:1357 length:513 start_codon:yes stop_codon:yes gene_type:complete